MNLEKKTTAEQLTILREIDIRTIDKSTLVDIADVHINTELPAPERVADYIKQIKNPYCYLSNGIVVKVSFSGKCSLEDCLKNAMFGEN